MKKCMRWKSTTAPDEKSKMHEHPGGVVVYITEGHLKFVDHDGSVKEVHAKPGDARFFRPSNIR
jgi:uncharacterized cupin superfamily protein